MTPRDAIRFVRSKTGAFLVFALLLAIALIVVVRLKTPKQELLVPTPVSIPPKPQLIERVSRAMTAFKPPMEKAAMTPAPTPAAVEKKADGKPVELPPISLFAASPGSEKPMEPLSRDYAPFGRLVPCELIITVDSSALDTPIVGLVTDDVWHDARLIIPAGTEIHGTARVDRVRERIANSGSWTFVWQSGEELTVTGIALDREKQAGAEGWGITDGSAGLRGRLIKSDDLAEIKLFAATFLSGAAGALTEKQSTLLGSVALPTLQNAPLAGAQQVLNTYAQQILETISRDGFYVRVPAGKQFYLYVTQTIDRDKAVLGGSRLAKKPEQESDPNDPITRLNNNLRRLTAPVSPSASGTITRPTTLPLR